jgi:hypothetical protein
MKKEALLFFVSIIAIGFVSSQNGLSDLLNQIDQSMVILFSIFIISFSLLFFALNKFFKKNGSIAGVISVAISFLITYGVNKSGFDFNNFFSSVGISSGTLGIVIPLILAAGTIYLIITLKRNSLFILGGLLIFVSFFVYAKTLLIVVGVILIGIRIFLQIKFPYKWTVKRIVGQTTNPNSLDYVEDVRG